jgi:hypothetical protein
MSAVTQVYVEDVKGTFLAGGAADVGISEAWVH